MFIEFTVILLERSLGSYIEVSIFFFYFGWGKKYKDWDVIGREN